MQLFGLCFTMTLRFSVEHPNVQVYVTFYISQFAVLFPLTILCVNQGKSLIHTYGGRNFYIDCDTIEMSKNSQSVLISFLPAIVKCH